MRIHGVSVARFAPATNPHMIEPVADLVRRSWGEPGGQVEQWMRLAEWGFAAYTPSGHLVGIALTRRVRSDAMWTIASVIDPAYRRSGVTLRLNMAPLWRLWCARLRREPRRAFARLALLSRSANPRVYRLLHERSEVFPHIDGREPTHDDLALLRRVCDIAGGPMPDEQSFVIPGASRPYPGLIPRPDAIPWSGDARIDRLFRERVELEDAKGHLLFVISRFRAHAPAWHAAKQSLRALRRSPKHGQDSR